MLVVAKALDLLGCTSCLFVNSDPPSRLGWGIGPARPPQERSGVPAGLNGTSVGETSQGFPGGAELPPEAFVPGCAAGGDAGGSVSTPQRLGTGTGLCVGGAAAKSRSWVGLLEGGTGASPDLETASDERSPESSHVPPNPAQSAAAHAANGFGYASSRFRASQMYTNLHAIFDRARNLTGTASKKGSAADQTSAVVRAGSIGADRSRTLLISITDKLVWDDVHDRPLQKKQTFVQAPEITVALPEMLPLAEAVPVGPFTPRGFSSLTLFTKRIEPC